MELAFEYDKMERELKDFMCFRTSAYPPEFVQNAQLLDPIV